MKILPPPGGSRLEVFTDFHSQFVWQVESPKFHKSPPRRKPKTLNSHKIDEDVCLNFCPSNMWDRERGCKKSWNLGVSYGCTRWEENKTGASIAIQCNTTLCTSMNIWWEERKNDFIAKLSQSITSQAGLASLLLLHLQHLQDLSGIGLHFHQCTDATKSSAMQYNQMQSMQRK